MAAWTTSCFNSDIAGADDVATIGCLVPLLKNMISAVIALAGVALFVMLIVSGFHYIFAGGDQKKLEMAKNSLTFAIIGLVVMVLAYLILFTIQTLTGVDVTNVRITL